MKRIKFIVMSVFLGGSIFLSSCNENLDYEATKSTSESEYSSLSKGSTELDAKQVAYYHNVAVELYYRNDDGSPKTIEHIQNSIIRLMTADYPQLMQDFKIPQDYNFIASEYRSSSLNSVQLGKIMDNGFNKMMMDRKISSTFSNDMKRLTLSMDSYSNKLNFINSYNVASPDEGVALDFYKETFMASNSLWQTTGTATNKRKKLKCSSDVIAADAVGAAVGLFGGPVWSIIQGAVVSIAINEGCND